MAFWALIALLSVLWFEASHLVTCAAPNSDLCAPVNYFGHVSSTNQDDHMKAMKLLHAHDSSEETLPGFINGFVANPEGPSDQAFQPQPPIPPPSSSVPAEPPSMGSDV